LLLSCCGHFVAWADSGLSLFIVQQDRIVDVSRHVEWQRCPLGQKWVTSACRGTALALDLDDIKNAIRLIDPSGNEQWRLPSREELTTLMCSDCSQQERVPAFASVPTGIYWSGDENIWAPGSYWTVNLHHFSIYGRNQPLARHYVLLVRNRPVPQDEGKAGALTK
jgi:hypothetical protein